MYLDQGSIILWIQKQPYKTPQDLSSVKQADLNHTIISYPDPVHITTRLLILSMLLIIKKGFQYLLRELMFLKVKQKYQDQDLII